MKLRTKFAVLLLVVTLVLSLATYGGLETFKRQQVAAEERAVDETAELAAEQLGAQVFSEMDRVGSYAGEMDLSKPNETERKLDDLVSRKRFQHGVVVNRSGQVVMVSGPYSDAGRAALVGSNVSDTRCVRRTLASGDLCVSPPQRANGTSFGQASHYVRMTAPVFADNGSGVNGTILVTYPLSRRSVFPGLAALDTSSQSVRVAYSGETLYGDGREFESSVAGQATVDRTGWVVRIERDRTTLDATLSRLALAQAGGIFLLMAIAVGFGYWEYAVNLRQTERLLDGFEALASGKYDTRVTLSAGEEWNQISAGFTALAADLGTREREIDEREQRLNVLNRVLRHNLRNRLNVVLSYVELIRESNEGETRERAKTALAAAQRLDGLASKSGKVEASLTDDTDPVATPLSPLIRDAARTSAREYPEADIRLDLDEVTGLARPEFSNAVREVIENSCEHAGDAPTVRVSLREHPERDLPAVVRVADDGPGVPGYEQSVIQRGHETDLEHGSGLGLWLTFWEIDSCGGQMAFHDDADGSVVELRLRTPTASDDGGTDSPNDDR